QTLPYNEQSPEQTPVISASAKKTTKTKVLEFHNDGCSIDTISQNLDISVREIELIISMFG
ncbi:MAG TPA: hypothetical protein VFC68_03600, partial [Treponemataceae bacterium]|nr:hypothetical protein [Treponemataceae bacterium]